MNDIKKAKFEAKKTAAKIRWQEMKWKAADFWERNKTEICVLVPVVLGAVDVVARTTSRAIQRKQETDRRKYVYDRSVGDYYKLRRRMTNSEMLELERRLANGEKKGQILKSMRLI